MDGMDLGMDLLDSHALGMGLGLAAPKKASRRDILLGRTSQAALEDEQARYGLGEGIAPGEVWQCHCCAKDNVATAAYCCCCGRGAGYRRQNASRPLSLPDCVAAMRANQVEGYLDGVARKKAADLAPAARDRFLAGPDGPINARDERGFTSLHVAALAANAGAVDVLVRRGALVEARTKPQGWRAMHLASYSGSKETVAALCNGGAKVDCATAACLSTPLHLCTDGEAAQILLDAGADPLALDVQGRTPLHTAAALGKVDVADAVVSAGGVAMLEMADGDNWLPEATAEFYSHHDFVRFCRLLEAEAQNKLIEELPNRAWAGDVWDAGMRSFARRKGTDLANGGKRSLIVEELLRIRGMRTTGMMEKHGAETRRIWADAERRRDEDLLSLEGSVDGSFVSAGSRNIVASIGTEGTMPLSGQAVVFDEYLANLKNDESDPVAMRRRNGVYSRDFDPLHKSITRELEQHQLIPVTDPRQGRPPLSLRRTPRQCHTILFGGER